MKLLEYQAKELFERAGLPTMRGCVVDDPQRIEQAIADANLAYPVVVKAQVQIGGRGKAGGIQFAGNAAEARAHCEKLLHSELRGFQVNQLLIVEKAKHEIEWYLSIILDRERKCPTIIFCAEGGMEIEDVAKTNPGAIHKLPVNPLLGVQEHMARYLLSSSALPPEYTGQLHALLQSLYQAFIRNDCLLCEINPLIVDHAGKLIALDGKVEVDDSALFRQPHLLALREAMDEEALVKEARSFQFLYIPVEAGGSIAVMSNGSGMLMSCIDLISKEGMHVGAALDLGGGATADRIREAMRILFSTAGIKAVLINIFGGITRCDEVAGGVKLFMEAGHDSRTVVVRMEGTNKEKGLEIIQSIPGDIVCVEGLRESVQAFLMRRERL